MGYYTHSTDCDFEIDEEQAQLIEFPIVVNTWSKLRLINNWEELEREFFFEKEIEHDHHGNCVGITHIEFPSGKHYYIKELFRILAPYVRPGSWIQFRGEEAEDIWRVVFDNDTYEIKKGKITW